MKLYGRNLLKETDLSAGEFHYLLGLAARLRRERQLGQQLARLAGRNVALICAAASPRDWMAAEVAARGEGAHVTRFGPGESPLGGDEPVRDAARVLGRMFDGIGYFGPAQRTVEALGAHAGVPVWNGGTSRWQPTRMLADLLTVRDHTVKPLTDVAYCHLGDGQTSAAHSLLVTGALLGMDVRICAPAALEPAADVWYLATALTAVSGARIAVTDDPAAAVDGVDYLSTGPWLAGAERGEVRSERIEQLLPYQVNDKLLALTGNPEVKVLHGLPAGHSQVSAAGRRHYGRRSPGALEVTDDIFGSPACVAFDQAENRRHAAAALMVATLADEA